MKVENLIGRKFNNWIVLNEAQRKNGISMWLCECICGFRKDVQGANLKSGMSKSCGCIAGGGTSEDGRSKRPFYGLWKNMMRRCYPRDKSKFAFWAAKGIEVDGRWHDLDVFITWCEKTHPGKPNYTLDRFPDRNGNYSPENCRWATMLDQSRNTSRNLFVNYKGKEFAYSEFVEKFGVVKYKTANARRHKGWDPIRAATAPLGVTTKMMRDWKLLAKR